MPILSFGRLYCPVGGIPGRRAELSDRMVTINYQVINGMSDNDTPLDISTLSELRAMLEEGLEELLVEYLDDTRSQLTKLRTAVASGDNAAIVSISHTLKGSSGNLGVSNVYRLCQALEQEARSGSVLDATASLRAIEVAFERAQQELAAFLAS